MPIGNKKGLGRGITSLINDYDNTAYEAEKLAEAGAKVQEIDISRIKPNPNQPRKYFDPDALAELAGSIEVQGIIQPLIVEEIAERSYVIVAGERRYRAAKMAGLTTVPCLVRSFTALQRVEVALIENIQRENLNPVEEAKAYQYLITTQGGGVGCKTWKEPSGCDKQPQAVESSAHNAGSPAGRKNKRRSCPGPSER